ncbi:MAG TPA: helix-turn-helix transcriptional regulator [Thermoanaerobaculia bacterium]|jgi:transcriptional regulator with XRE-family HTH domain|nr:helix-turn-helix transcriptional regulator [Thermoanaerobaculia bacterium]
MATDTWLQSKLRKSAGHVGYEIERLLIGINEEIVAQMEAKGITRTELARRLGVDKSYVTRMLNGMPNMTLKTLVSVASALDCQVSMPSFSKLTVAGSDHIKVPAASKRPRSRKSRQSRVAGSV